MEGKADNAVNAVAGYLGIKALNGANAPYKDYSKSFEDSNKVYGPVDCIKSTYMRSDAGLDFSQTITLVFEYELKSYNGINGKQAMLDLISNILNVTYTTGSFWGGGYKGFATPHSNIFNNLEIFKTKGGFTDFVESFSNDIHTLTEKAKNAIKGKGFGEIIGNIANRFY